MYIYESTIRLKLLQRPRNPRQEPDSLFYSLLFGFRILLVKNSENMLFFVFFDSFGTVLDASGSIISMSNEHALWLYIALIPRWSPLIREYEIRRHRTITDGLVRIRSPGKNRTALTSMFGRYRHRVNVGRDDPTGAKRLRGEIADQG